MLKTGNEIRRQVISGLKNQAVKHPKEIPAEKIEEYREVAKHIQSMRRTPGWKLVEAWITEKIGFLEIIYKEDSMGEKERAKAYIELLTWVEQMAEGAFLPIKGEATKEVSDE